jgi:hypothetical protein
MTENTESIPGFKIHKENVIYSATFLCGPFAGGYLMAENFKALGDKKNYKKTLIITFGVCTIICVGLAVIPGIDKIPNFVFPIVFSFAAYLLVTKYQGKQITDHISSGGKTFSIGRSVLIGLISVLLTFAIILPIVYFTFPGETQEIVYQPYGAVKHELYYSPENIEKNEVKSLGKILTEINYFDSTYAMCLSVYKEEKSIKISIPFTGPAWQLQNDVEYYKEMQKILQDRYPDNDIVVLMCDSNLTVKKTITGK